jgi:hypothetical protein
MMPLAAMLVFMPLMVQPLAYSFETLVFGLPRILTHLMPIQWYELRFSPTAALALLAASDSISLARGTPAGVQVSKTAWRQWVSVFPSCAWHLPFIGRLVWSILQS